MIDSMHSTSSKAIPAQGAAHSAGAMPEHAGLVQQAERAGQLVEDIVLKNYLAKLADLDVLPLDADMQRISDIRMFRITEMVYQAREHSGHKFTSVFNALQNLNCGIFVIADSNGEETDFYMGIRALDEMRTPKSLKNTLRNALCGQFPGIKTEEMREDEIKTFLTPVREGANLASVSCVAEYKAEDSARDENFVQGLEKLALAMQGHKYTMLVLAKSVSNEELAMARKAYENIYSDMSPLTSLQLTYGTNEALSVSTAFSRGTSESFSTGWNISYQSSTSTSVGKNVSHSESHSKSKSRSGSASVILASVSISRTTTDTSSNTISYTTTHTTTHGNTKGSNETQTEGTNTQHTQTDSTTKGSSQSMALTRQNKVIQNILQRIDGQLERIAQCESQGMWECAAYFLSDSQETAEMAAGTYRAIMQGEKSGLELSAINVWGRNETALPAIRDYLSSLLHPLFMYHNGDDSVPVSAAALVSGQELAILMGLPRKSVCGFPVVEHADFGKEVIRYSGHNQKQPFKLGTVYNMGRATDTRVTLDRDSLPLHTFITGSTGSGKSNTVYEILHQLKRYHDIPFLVIEPTKGEYKNVFGEMKDVTVYGTNPQKFEKLLRLNPFRFHQDIHLLEHMDRLVEVFNACWPMYAAMPAVLKEAMQRAYEAVGWDVLRSENPSGYVFPGFADLLEQVEAVVAESSYSADSKGDYAGALCTRIRSLCTGINAMLFGEDDLDDAELFDHSAIVDLSRIGSMETKALIMGLLITRLNEYRMSSHESNRPLSHVTVLEEAHNLLKRTSMEQTGEGANLLGKAVELMANSIAEMRTYGEAFIIVDQTPALLDMAAIRNTNTKIILRLPDQTDRDLVGRAANLDDEQIRELARLERGVAAVYQNDWVEPVLVKISKCELEEKRYIPSSTVQLPDRAVARQRILRFLLQGRLSEQMDFDALELRHQLHVLSLPHRIRHDVEAMLDACIRNERPTLWDNSESARLARLVAEFSGELNNLRLSLAKAEPEKVDECVLSVCRAMLPHASEQAQTALAQCLVWELGKREPGDTFKKLYELWSETVERRLSC